MKNYGEVSDFTNSGSITVNVDAEIDSNGSLEARDISGIYFSGENNNFTNSGDIDVNVKVAADSSSAEATDIQGIYGSFYSLGDVTNSGAVSVIVEDFLRAVTPPV